MKKNQCLGAILMVLCLLACTWGSASAMDSAPLAENMEFNTFRECSFGGRLSGYDQKGGPLKYHLTTRPVKGTVELKEDGSFLYTPEKGKKGRDYFGYKVEDANGSFSQEATVIIRIEKPEKPIAYMDMDGAAEEYAAQLLADRELFLGEQIGGQYCFDPEKPVCRGEFLAICLRIDGEWEETPVLKTDYVDDAVISCWLKPYVQTASRLGLYRGTQQEEGHAFGPYEAISRMEAAMMLQSCMQTEESREGAAATLVPQRQACQCLHCCGVWEQNSISPDLLTRREMAAMIASSLAHA